MELEMGFAVLGIVAVTAAAVYLVSVMGIKEKSFEEAIAEQKKRSDDLLGRKEAKRKVTVKDKSKKQKKAKEKEKHQVPYVGDVVNAQSQQQEEEQEVVVEKHHHVEIDPEPEILDDLSASESRRASVIRMRESLKSILINKEEHSPVFEQETPEPTNHFEDIVPKDDLELKKHINNYDESSPPPSPPPPLPQRQLKKKKEETITPTTTSTIMVGGIGGAGDGPPSLSSETNLNVSGYYENVPIVVDDLNEATQLESLNSPDDGPYDGRQFGERGGARSRKTKQRGGIEQERDQVTAAKLENTIEKVSLSSSEIQNLIDVLLNKQHAGDSEWINKGKNDSVGNLKKQLAERERQLNEEQITVQTLQSKLKELRHEFTSEKSKFSQLRRQLEDTGTQKMQEVQQLQVRLQQLRQEAIGEKQTLQQKLQQMQLSLNTLRDENVAVKGALAVEQGNRGKAELHTDSLEREAEALRTQCGHLENQLKAAFQSNQELSNQSRNLQEHLRLLEERKKQEEHSIHAQYGQQIQERDAHLLSELKKSQDLLAEGEKERINLRQQNSNLQNSLRNSQETAITLDEVTKKLEELRETEKNTKNLFEDSVSQATSLKSQLQSTESKLQRLEEERKNLQEQVVVLTEKQLIAEKEREKLNSDIKSHVEQMNKNETNEASADKSKLEQFQTLLSEKEAVLKELSKTNASLENEVHKAIEELKSQKEMNDDLRLKNVKIMDTLSLTERNLETRITQCELLVQEERVKAREETEKSISAVFQKHFPQCIAADSPDWIDNFAKRMQQEIEIAKRSAQPISNDSNTSVAKLEEVNARLQEEVSHYQNVLSSTETLLSNLQSSIEKEERKWHQKLQQKEAELTTFKGQMPSVNTEVTKLKSLLDTEREEKSVLGQRCIELENNIQNLKKQIEQNDSLRKTLERLEGEVNEERRKGAELSTENSRLESEVIRQQVSCKAEQEKVTQLQQEIASLKSVESSSIISSNGVVNGKSVVTDGSSSASPPEPVVKTGENPLPHASTSSTTTTSTAPNATNADVSSKESKPKKKKGVSGRKV